MTGVAADPRTSVAPPHVVAPAGRPGSALTGTRSMLWLVLRRDRFRICLWFLGLVGLMSVSASSVVTLYETPEELERYARTVRGNSALIVQAGPGYGLDEPTVGAVMMNEAALWVFIAVGVMSLFMVVRHTRTEEETERAELVRAAPVGRHASLVAAMLGVLVVNAVIAIGNVIALVAFGLPTVGSVAFGSSIVGIGLVIGAVSAVAAQVASGSRGALAAGAVVIGAAFVLRAVGDVGNGVLSWGSPIGWAQAVRAYADERWWVLVLPLLATVALLTVATALLDRRDFGSGLVAQRSGRPGATPRLSTPVGLALRLQRGALIGWATGVGTLAFFYGLIADEAEQLIEDNPDMADFIAQLGSGSVTDAFLSTAMLIMALISSGFTVSAVLRLRAEEFAGRADPVLAAPISRRRWAVGHLAVAAFGSAILALACGAAMGLAAAVALADADRVVELIGAGAVMVPAMWVMAAGTLLLHGLRPRWSVAAWALVGWVFVAAMFGSVLDLPQWMLNVSPFEHVPALPAAAMSWLPLIVLTSVAGVTTMVALVALDRRDMA
jgi:ABC-2 type transport system permease protein